jgi:hypothetical protein
VALAVEHQDMRYTVYQDIRYTLRLLAVRAITHLMRPSSFSHDIPGMNFRTSLWVMALAMT